MVKQVNQFSVAIDAWKTSVDDMESFVNEKQREISVISEEEAELKSLGQPYFGKDRKDLRKQSSRLFNEHNNLFNNPIQGASQIKSIKKMVEKGELPSWVQEIAAEAFKKGISIKEYFKFMKTPAYDKFLDKQIESLESVYKRKKQNLESIVKRGSK